jgi:hypothetical protein
VQHCLLGAVEAMVDPASPPRCASAHGPQGLVVVKVGSGGGRWGVPSEKLEVNALSNWRPQVTQQVDHGQLPQGGTAPPMPIQASYCSR